MFSQKLVVIARGLRDGVEQVLSGLSPLDDIFVETSQLHKVTKVVLKCVSSKVEQLEELLVRVNVYNICMPFSPGSAVD